jgi:hypothetical protein
MTEAFADMQLVLLRGLIVAADMNDLFSNAGFKVIAALQALSRW